MSVLSVTSSSNRTTTSPNDLALIYKCAAFLSCTLAIVLLSGNTLRSQQPDPGEEIVRVDTHLVVFPIRLRDKRGQAVSGVTVDRLTLKDDDNVTTGLYLYEGTDRVSLVFALDQSGSLREIMNQQRDAALRLFQRFGEKSQVAV